LREARRHGISWNTAFVIEKAMYHPKNNSQFKYIKLYETKDLKDLYENNIVKDRNGYYYIGRKPSKEIKVSGRVVNLRPINEEYKINALERCLYWHNYMMSLDLLEDGSEYKNEFKKILMEIKLEG
jgi:hypothetical protein